MTRATISLGGQQLETHWIGPSPGRASTVVFLHEGLGCVSTWRDFPDRLCAATGWSGLVTSRLGYGASDPVSLPRPLDYMHTEAQEMLPRLLEHFAIERAVFFGHSDGGSIALIHAGSGVCFPGLAGLVLEAPHVFVEEVGLRAIERARRDYETGDLRQRLARHHGANVDVAFRGWNEAWLDPGFRSWNLECFLPAVRQPQLLLQGDADPYGSVAQLDSIEHHTVGETRTALLPGCGHAPHREATEPTLEETAAFLLGLEI